MLVTGCFEPHSGLLGLCISLFYQYKFFCVLPSSEELSTFKVDSTSIILKHLLSVKHYTGNWGHSGEQNKSPCLVKSTVCVDNTKFIWACFCSDKLLKRKNTVSSLFELCRVILEVQIFMIAKTVQKFKQICR